MDIYTPTDCVPSLSVQLPFLGMLEFPQEPIQIPSLGYVVIRTVKLSMNFIIMDFGLQDKEDRKNFLGLFHETIEELEPEVKDIVLYQMKLSAERRFEIKKNYLSRSYERERFRHRDDYERIVLEGDCENCKIGSIVVWSKIEYRKKFSSLNRDDPIKVDCGNCNSKNSFIISNF